jgi:hypothetical protein
MAGKESLFTIRRFSLLVFLREPTGAAIREVREEYSVKRKRFFSNLPALLGFV